MGCFSFMCNVCGKPINSTSLRGENVRLSLLDKGMVIEEMQGQYDSYGRVFDKKGESIEWNKPWGDVCDLMFEGDSSSGICAAHVACIGVDYEPDRKSDDDPDQGWGKLKKEHMGKCEIYHKNMTEPKMKKLVINNLAIQFSCFDHENNMEAAQELFDTINEILRDQLPDIDIKILVSDMFSSIDIDEID